MSGEEAMPSGLPAPTTARALERRPVSTNTWSSAAALTAFAFATSWALQQHNRPGKHPATMPPSRESSWCDSVGQRPLYDGPYIHAKQAASILQWFAIQSPMCLHCLQGCQQTWPHDGLEIATGLPKAVWVRRICRVEQGDGRQLQECQVASSRAVARGPFHHCASCEEVVQFAQRRSDDLAEGVEVYLGEQQACSRPARTF